MALQSTYRAERSLLARLSAPALVGALFEGLVRAFHYVSRFASRHPIASALIGYALGGSGGALIGAFVAGGLWWSRRRHARAALHVRVEPACQHRPEYVDYETDAVGRRRWRCWWCGETGEA